MKLKEIIEFPYFYQQIKRQKISFKLAYKLAKIYKRVQEEFEFYQTKLNQIIYECAQLDESGQPKKNDSGILIRQDKLHYCQESINQLQDLEITLDQSLTQEELASLEITPQIITKILPFIK